VFTPTNLTFTASGGTLNLTWPQAGWILQSNSVSLVSTGAWFDVPGSGAVTNLNISTDSTKTNVFYRLRAP